MHICIWMCTRSELSFCLFAVLPDADRMQHSYVNMVFDNDPTAEHDRLAKLSNKQRKRISGALPSVVHCIEQPQPRCYCLLHEFQAAVTFLLLSTALL